MYIKNLFSTLRTVTLQCVLSTCTVYAYCINFTLFQLFYNVSAQIEYTHNAQNEGGRWRFPYWYLHSKCDPSPPHRTTSTWTDPVYVEPSEKMAALTSHVGDQVPQRHAPV